MTLGKLAAVLALAATLAGCNLFPKPVPARPGENPLAPFPDGTVDTTHGRAGRADLAALSAKRGTDIDLQPSAPRLRRTLALAGA